MLAARYLVSNSFKGGASALRANLATNMAQILSHLVTLFTFHPLVTLNPNPLCRASIVSLSIAPTSTLPACSCACKASVWFLPNLNVAARSPLSMTWKNMAGRFSSLSSPTKVQSCTNSEVSKLAVLFALAAFTSVRFTKVAKRNLLSRSYW